MYLYVRGLKYLFSFKIFLMKSCNLKIVYEEENENEKFASFSLLFLLMVKKLIY